MFNFTKKTEKNLDNYWSTTTLAKNLGKESKDLFSLLDKNKWIIKNNGSWELTELGKKKGGEIKTDKEKNSSWIIWPPEIKSDEIFSTPTTPTKEKKQNLITAKIIGERHGLIPARINLILSELGWITKEKNGWVLTDMGKNIGGKQFEHEKTGIPFVCWPPNIDENKDLKESINQTLIPSNDTKTENMESKATDETDKKNIDYRDKFEAKNRSTDGHYVRSRGEMLIDNWLYMSEIVHAYERKLPVEEEVYSDFYLPKGKVYIEYWGYENDAKYIERKKKKIDIYKKYNLNLIELNNKDLENLDDILPKKLLKFNIIVY